MVQVTCQHSGLVFEAKSARSKNHPAISQILTDAYRDGVYDAVIEAITAGRDAGISSVEEFQSIARTAGEEAKAGKPRRRTWGDRIRASKARERQNAALQAAGYRWSKEPIPNQSPLMDDWDESWMLLDPSGNPVRLSDALAAIGHQQ